MLPRERLESSAAQAASYGAGRSSSNTCMAEPQTALPSSRAGAWAALDWQPRQGREDGAGSSAARQLGPSAATAPVLEEPPLREDEVLGAFGGLFDDD
jgi:hypothetical protein